MATIKQYIYMMCRNIAILASSDLVPFSYAGANDFNLLANEVLTIPSTAAVSTAVCHDIPVPGDMIVEDNETFTITVEASNQNDVIIGPSTATVTILDNDSKSIQHGIICIIHLKCVSDNIAYWLYCF